MQFNIKYVYPSRYAFAKTFCNCLNITAPKCLHFFNLNNNKKNLTHIIYYSIHTESPCMYTTNNKRLACVCIRVLACCGLLLRWWQISQCVSSALRCYICVYFCAYLFLCAGLLMIYAHKTQTHRYLYICNTHTHTRNVLYIIYDI